MSPELLRISEQREHSGFLWTIIHAIIATHLAYATAWLCCQLSPWAFATGYLVGIFGGLWWKSFRRADTHFAAIEADNLSRPGAWQRPFGHITSPSSRAACDAQTNP